MTKINIILLGESGVGKTTLLLRFQTGQFPNPDSNKVTCSPELQVKKFLVEDQEITLFIWDTPGQEKLRSVVKNYYRQGEGVLLMYDVTNYETFLKLSGWLRELRNANDKAEVLIAGNKHEDESKIAVAASVVRRFANEENLEYIEMSAKTGKNVEEAFTCLVKKILIAKGILTLPASKDGNQCDGSSENGIYENIVPRNSIKDKDPDIIRLEDTPVQQPSNKKPCC